MQDGGGVRVMKWWVVKVCSSSPFWKMLIVI